MKVGSLFSGIGAPEVAWQPLGWDFRWCAEIEAFASRVLAQRFPTVPNLGDVTKVDWDAVEPVDLIVGGSPCQSFSVAGKRLGMGDLRGNLALVMLAILGRVHPTWMVFENVPGLLSSDGGRDFGIFLGELGKLGYGFAYRILDAQWFGVPQRRRRVFVVGYLGDWRPPAAVLFERASLRGNPAPRREAGERVTGAVVASSGGSDENDAEQSRLIAFGGNNTGGPLDVATARNGHAVPHGRLDFESETFIAAIQERATSENAEAGPDGAGVRTDGRAYTLEARTVPQAVAFSSKNHGADVGELAPKLRSMGHDASHANGGGQVAVAFGENIRGEVLENPIARALQVGGGQPGQGYPVARIGSSVRRLTPRECERLQGFPDDWTLVSYRGKPAADGPRYKAIGNSMAVPVMAWIGQRIELVNAVLKEQP